MEKGSSFYGFLSRQFLIGFLVGLLGVLGASASVTLSSWHRALSFFCAVVLAALAAVFWKKKLPRQTVFALPLLQLTLLAQATCAVGTFGGSCFGLLRDWAEGATEVPVSIHSGLALVAMLATLSVLLILLQRRAGETDTNGSLSAIPLDRVYDDMATCYGLTSRERDILELLGKGYSRPHIGRELYLSESTVKTHAGNLYRKLGIHKHDELLKLIAGWPSGE